MAHEVVISNGIINPDFPQPSFQNSLEARLRAEAPNFLMDATLEELAFCAQEPERHSYVTLQAWKQIPKMPVFRREGSDYGFDTEDHNQQVDAANPPETAKALLAGLYKLTGAEVVRNDLADGETRGVIVRKGEYKGSTVFFRERYTDASPESSYYQPEGEDQVSLGLSIWGEDSGATVLQEITNSQQQALVSRIGESGIDIFVGYRDVTPGGRLITRENFETVLRLIDGVGEIALGKTPINPNRRTKLRLHLRDLADGFAVMGR